MDRVGFAILGLLGLLGVTVLAGCSTLDLRERLPWASSGPKTQVPTRMVDVWSDEILPQPGLPPVRGFGGRIMFYAGAGNAPVAVDGTLTVLAFDEADHKDGYTIPERKFVYLPEHLSKYYRKSEIGHSYSLWLPWDEVGGPLRKLCLIARFEPKKGTEVLVSKPCRVVLPGVPSPAGEPGAATARSSPSKALGGVRGVSHEVPVRDDPPAKDMTILTLNVPRSLARPDLPGAEPPAPAITPAASPAWAAAAALAPAGASATSRPAPDRPATPDLAPPARSGRSRFPARTGSEARSKLDPVRRQPLPGVSLSALPSTPRSGWTGQASAPSGADESGPR